MLNLIIMKGKLFCITFLLLCTVSFAQDIDCKLFMSKLGRGRAQQGMEIYGKWLFSCEDQGHVNVYEFKAAPKGASPVAGFELASSREDNHVNNVEFGPRKAKGSRFPLLYISNGKVGSEIEWLCYVERINYKKGVFSSEIVQTIELDGNGWESKGYTAIFGAPSWLIDKDRGFLWVFSAIKRTTYKVTPDPSQNRYIATKFRIPSLKEGAKVKLGADDILDQVTFPFNTWFTQAGCMRDGKIYYGFGIGNYDPHRPSVISVYDTDSGKIAAKWDLNEYIPCEIEDLVVKGGRLYVNCNNNPKRTSENPPIYVIALPEL